MAARLGRPGGRGAVFPVRRLNHPRVRLLRLRFRAVDARVDHRAEGDHRRDGTSATGVGPDAGAVVTSAGTVRSSASSHMDCS